jgi:hypothetical protein
MDAFLDYEEQLKELCVSLRKHAEVIPTAKGDAKRKAIATRATNWTKRRSFSTNKKKKKSNLFQKLTFVSSSQQSLTLAAHGLGTQQAKAKVKTFEQELASLRSNIDRAKMLYGASTDRDELMSGGTVPADLATTSMDHRQRVAADTEKLKRTTDVIREAQQSAESTVQLGIGSLAELHAQRETIQNSQAKLRTVDQHLARDSASCAAWRDAS